MSLKAYFISVILVLFSVYRVFSEEIGPVVVTIKPLHSLVSGVMGTTGNPELLVVGHDSPHGIHLKPSQIKSLQSASILFYLDSNFETFLQGLIQTLPAKVHKAGIIQGVDFTLLKRREGGVWNKDFSYDHTRAESMLGADMHVWLDPKNAQKIVKFIVQELSAAFPENQPVYEANGHFLVQRLEALDARLANALSDMRNKGFLVSHDAYGYFEKRYSLHGVGALASDPDDPLPPKTLHNLRKSIKEGKVACIFHEPGFSARWISAVREGSSIPLGILDPEGINLAPGSELYEILMENLARDFKSCF